MLLLGGDFAGKGLVPVLRRGDSLGQPGRAGVTVPPEDYDKLAATSPGAASTRCRWTRQTGQAQADPAARELFRTEIKAQAQRWCDLAASGSTRACGASSRRATTTRSRLTRCTGLRAGRVPVLSGVRARAVLDGEPRRGADHAVEYRARGPGGGDRPPYRGHAGALWRDTRWILNFHCPPYADARRRPGAGRDAEAGHPGRQAEHRAGRQPRGPGRDQEIPAVVALHGHIHESRGVQKIGKTLCINPGSDYSSGVLRGAVVDLAEDGTCLDFLLTTG